MPRYGDPEYDPDFDDSPPPTPKYHPPPPARWRSWAYMIRRNKGLIVFSIFFFSFLRFLKTERRPIFTPKHEPTLNYKHVDWRLYAYSQYATSTDYLCNSILLFDSLDRLGSRADRILMYPKTMDTHVSNGADRSSQLLIKARDEYRAKLTPVELEAMRSDNWNDPRVKSDAELSDRESYDMSISKFLAFNQTQYLRVLHLDSDATVLKNLDELFLLPSARIAMPRAYWRTPPGQRTLSPHLMLLEPSSRELQRLLEAAEAETRSDVQFDREIVNAVFADAAMVLPHRAFGLPSAELRRADHRAYHGNDWEVWSPDRAFAEASLVHFADHPLPKPWVMWPPDQLARLQPACHDIADPNRAGCRNRELWLDLYRTFRKRRKDLCGLLSVPAPEYPPHKDVPDKDQED